MNQAPQATGSIAYTDVRPLCIFADGQATAEKFNE